METQHEYENRIKKLKNEIQIQNDNKRKVVLREFLLKELKGESRIAIHVLEEYNSITKLPF